MVGGGYNICFLFWDFFVVREESNPVIGSAQLGLKVLKKRFFSYEKRFFMRKKLTSGRVEVICVNLVVFRPVDFHGRFYFFSLRLLRPFWKILSARLLFANVF